MLQKILFGINNAIGTTIVVVLSIILSGATTSTSTLTTTSTVVAAAAAAVSAADTDTDTDTDDNPLSGVIICIDPGHQGKQNSDLEPIAPGSGKMKPKVSSGTAGVVTRIAEYELNLDVGLRLREMLVEKGAKVVMTRESHDVDISNAERAQVGNDAGADLSVRIHADGNTNKDLNGISMQIPSADSVGEALASTSKAAGAVVLVKVIESTGAKDRGLVLRSDLTGFNWTTVPSILIEMGFMSNAEEDRLLADDSYRTKLAAGLCNGIVEYFTS